MLHWNGELRIDASLSFHVACLPPESHTIMNPIPRSRNLISSGSELQSASSAFVKGYTSTGVCPYIVTKVGCHTLCHRVAVGLLVCLALGEGLCPAFGIPLLQASSSDMHNDRLSRLFAECVS